MSKEFDDRQHGTKIKTHRCINEEFLEKEHKRLVLETLSRLEHEQWVTWSKSITKTEKLSKDRLYRWKKLWISYAKLSEEDKEHDRKWAKKVIKIIEDTR